METIRTAVVVKATGSRYMLHDLASQATVEGRLRGRLRLSGSRSTSPVVVGDIVDYEPELPVGIETAGDGTGRTAPGTEGDGTGGRAAGGAGAAGVPGKSCTSGTVVALHPRRNYIIRRASNLSKESHIIAANIDQALLVVSLVRPATNSEFIDRFLVTAGAYHIPAAIDHLYYYRNRRTGTFPGIPFRPSAVFNRNDLYDCLYSPVPATMERYLRQRSKPDQRDRSDWKYASNVSAR